MVAIAERPTTQIKTEAELRPLTERLPYGPTGLPVSRLCWGTGLMAVLKHNLSHADAAKVLIRGLELGVNFWDTADGYKTHPHVGEALRQVGRARRSDVVVNSKTKAKTAAEARADVDRFLAEMGTEYIDTLLLHGIETVEELERRSEAMDEIQKLKQSGKLKGVGISTHLGTGAIMDACAKDERIEVILTSVNVDGQMLKGSMETHRPLVEKVFEAKKGITLMKTLAQGGLTKTPEMVRDAIRFNLSLPYAHSVCVGVNTVEEVEFAVKVAAEYE